MLPIKFRISYKILLLAYKALNDLAPAYLTNLLSRYNPTHSLRSQNSGLLVVPRIAKSTKGGRTFSYLAPKLWNSLPDNVLVQTHSLCCNLTCNFIEQSLEDPWKCTVNLDLNMGFLGILVKKGECFISYYELYLCWFMQNYFHVQLCCVQN